MTRIWTATMLLIGVVGVCFGGLFYQQRQVRALTAELEELEAAYHATGSTAAAAAEDFAADFRRRTRLFPLFMSHEALAASEECAALLPVRLAAGGRDEGLAELKRCRVLLDQLAALERPTPENIF